MTEPEAASATPSAAAPAREQAGAPPTGEHAGVAPAGEQARTAPAGEHAGVAPTREHAAAAPARRGGEPRPEAHPFSSPSLFVDITTITVDPAYVAAAARRAADPAAKPARATSLLAVATLLLVGGVWGVAAAQTRDRAPAAARIRASLATEAQRRTSATDRLAAEQERLRRETADAREAALRQSVTGRLLSAELRRLEMAAGGARVRGPGLVVTVDDAEMAGDDTENRVTDADLQTIVNALWGSGAEAVSVNDRRIGSLTAIREAGSAILVDYRPLSPPYVIKAIGDPDVLDPAFADSPAARRFRTYVEAYGLRFDVDRAKSLDLPGSETTRLRHAAPATRATPGATPPATPGQDRPTPEGKQ